ncbi:helix-turn-helix transcriptional regulator, partial [Saccharothrix sp. MB29]|nr:helix-turn-helix transcriptional regulator [Saccharothrix sp. MB29]
RSPHDPPHRRRRGPFLDDAGERLGRARPRGERPAPCPGQARHVHRGVRRGRPARRAPRPGAGRPARARRRSAVKVGVLVEELGWSVAKISKLEHGTRGASLPDIARYAGRLHADQPTYDHIMSLAQAQNTGHVVR